MFAGSKKLNVPDGFWSPFCEAIETIFLVHGATRGSEFDNQADGMSWLATETGYDFKLLN
jgi:hypothetical protein